MPNEHGDEPGYDVRRWEWEREGCPRDIFGLPDDGNRGIDLAVAVGFFAFVAVVACLAAYGLGDIIFGWQA